MASRRISVFIAFAVVLSAQITIAADINVGSSRAIRTLAAGVGVVLLATKPLANRKGFLVTNASLTVRNYRGRCWTYVPDPAFMLLR